MTEITLPMAEREPPVPKLSICITTFNRAAFIGETLDSILSELTRECEIVLLDAASTDATNSIVSAYAERCNQIRYIRQPINNGIDRDYDRSVELARGEYCWLMTDDDLIRPGAIASVLQAIRRHPSLVVVNFELRDLTMGTVLQSRGMELASDATYGPDELDRLFVDLDEALMYVGITIIQRDLWLSRKRQSYYGSLFIHAGVIFQSSLPGEAIVIANPCISYRMGNGHTWLSQKGEVIFSKWPTVVSTMAISESAKKAVRSAQPWRDTKWLIMMRGRGWYSATDYRQWIRPQLRSMQESLLPALVAVLPGVITNAVLVAYYSLRRDRGQRLQWMRQSRFYFPRWLPFNRTS